MKIYVDINAFRDGNGTAERPYKHINDAAAVAMPGDEVLVAPGIYREYVNPIHPGTEDARITYRSTRPLGAVITGAEEVKTWKPYEGDTWVCRVGNSIFGRYNPYTTFVYGDWYSGKKEKHTGAVYLNSKMLYETATLEECMAGNVQPYSWDPEGSRYKWYTEQDGEDTVIYANFRGKNPNRETVEINVRRECFMPDKTFVSYITVSGFAIEKAATTWAPPAAFQDCMIGPHWSKGWIIEDCEISNSKCAGIGLGKYRDPENDMYFTNHHVKSPTQMERDALCRGLSHGWVKEKVGSHIVRRCNIHHCEQGGIIGRMGGVFSVIEDNHIHHINNMIELSGAEVAGIKMHAAIDVTMRRNHIHHCIMGIWCDWQAQGTRITQNLLHDNQLPAGIPQRPMGMMCQDIFVEISHGPTLIDNNVLLSEVSVRLSTEGVAMVHNLICGSVSAAQKGGGGLIEGNLRERYTPYHMHHRTEVMGFMTLLQGDDRYFNNIFVQRQPENPQNEENTVVGTFPMDPYPTYEEWISQFDMDSDTPGKDQLAAAHFHPLPVYTGGNAFFNGARAWKHESDFLMDTEHTVTVELEEQDGRPVLKTNVYDFLQEFSGRMVNSDVLGKAFEPEQLYENPDGTPITFDRDYFGDHRGIRVLPGPFAEKDGAARRLW